MLTPAEAQDNIMKDEIRKIIHHEISQTNVVKFSKNFKNFLKNEKLKKCHENFYFINH
jgi:hypothetical protein